MDRQEKKDLVASLNTLFGNATTVVVVHYKGLSVVEMEALRGVVRDQQAGFKVTKNRLTRLALDGTPFAPLQDLFTGPTAIAWSEDAVAAAKAMHDYAKKNQKLEILGGAMGETVLDAQGVEALAKMPSLDELRGKLVGLLQAPAQKVAAVLQAPGGQLARVVQAYADKQGDAA